MAMHYIGSAPGFFGEDYRGLEVAVHRLTDPPPASLVEVDRRPSCRDPQLFITLLTCPPLKVREQKPSNTCSPTVGPNDHAQHPR